MASSSSTQKDSAMAAASSSSSSTKKTIVLISKEGENFEVDEAIALLSQTVKSLIEDDCIDGGIPLPNVDSETLAKVLEYCTPHASGGDEDLSKLDSEYVKDLKGNQNMLFDVIQAANYLNIEKLLNLTCQTVADMMKGKSPEQIRKIFHIKNDYSAEEEAAVREENKWAFD